MTIILSYVLDVVPYNPLVQRLSTWIPDICTQILSSVYNGLGGHLTVQDLDFIKDLGWYSEKVSNSIFNKDSVSN